MYFVRLKPISLWSGVLFLLIVLLAACSSAENRSQAPVPTFSPPAHPYTWIIASSALQLLIQTDSSGTLARSYFDTPDTYLLGTTSANLPAQWQSVPTADFASYVDLRKALTTHSLAPQIKAIVYDNEAWSFTPPQEQRDPALYDRLAAELVHQNHLLFIATPATDLAGVINPAGGNKYENFLQLGIARTAAHYADIYEIQAQGSEMNTTMYETFVQQAAEQARAANPSIKVLAGLSTNPGGRRVTGEELYQAVMATRNIVKGYWLNIPAGGSRCPRCGIPRPQVAVDFLQKLSVHPA